jgi:membrane-associated phospholipid phosphatase
MFRHFRSTFFGYRVPKLFIVLLVLLSFGMLSPAAAQTDAGTWQTWVLESGDQFRLDAPPDEAVTTEEIGQLLEMVDQRDDEALQQIAYWNAGPPSYRWNQIAVNALVAHANPLASRNLALLHVAIYDATVAAWDSKASYNRPRPSEVEPAIAPVIPNPSSPSYPSEYAVTAGAASTILAWLFPDEAQMFQDKAQAAVNSRLLAGVEYPSDVEAGLALGRQVAELVIARGIADGTDAKWEGTLPPEAGHWTGENPLAPMAGTWQTWVLTSPDQFRPAPPPAYDSEQMAAEMAELKNFERTPVTNALATFWEFGAGGRRNYWFWNDVAGRLVLEAHMDDNPPLAARAYALANIANHDAFVACFDAKYTYWAMRPFQIDSEFTPLFATPNHPAYPSAHSCISMATAGVLAHLFPVGADEVLALAHEAGESRIWAGIHFRSDVEAGIMLGQNVADAVIAHAENDGA